MSDPVWLQEGILASFNDDTFRAELSPRRTIDGKVCTPEQAAIAPKGKVKVDWKGRKHPKVWKLYEKDARGRFIRVGEVAEFEDVAARVPSE